MISDDLRIHERWEGPWFHLPGSGTYCPGIVDCSQPSKVCRSIMKFFQVTVYAHESHGSVWFFVWFCDEKSDTLPSQFGLGYRLVPSSAMSVVSVVTEDGNDPRLRNLVVEALRDGSCMGSCLSKAIRNSTHIVGGLYHPFIL